jgi:hypothetical protein
MDLFPIHSLHSAVITLRMFFLKDPWFYCRITRLSHGHSLLRLFHPSDVTGIALSNKGGDNVTHVECALLRQLRLPLAPRPVAAVQVSGPGQRPMAGGSGKGYSLHELPFTVQQPC